MSCRIPRAPLTIDVPFAKSPYPSLQISATHLFSGYHIKNCSHPSYRYLTPAPGEWRLVDAGPKSYSWMTKSKSWNGTRQKTPLQSIEEHLSLGTRSRRSTSVRRVWYALRKFAHCSSSLQDEIFFTDFPLHAGTTCHDSTSASRGRCGRGTVWPPCLARNVGTNHTPHSART